MLIVNSLYKYIPCYYFTNNLLIAIAGNRNLFPLMVIFQFTFLLPCTYLPASMQAQGRRQRDCNKGQGSARREIKREEMYFSLSPSLSLSSKSSPFIQNCGTHLIRGRKWIRVTQSKMCLLQWTFLPELKSWFFFGYKVRTQESDGKVNFPFG